MVVPFEKPGMLPVNILSLIHIFAAADREAGQAVLEDLFET